MPSYVREVFDLTDDLISRYGPRIPGSRACEQAARSLKAEFERICDETHIQSIGLIPSTRAADSLRKNMLMKRKGNICRWLLYNIQGVSASI